jgi:thymidylate synthase (FAD)
VTTNITIRSDFDVDYIDHAGNDERVCQAARVSTKGADAVGTEVSWGLVNHLMANRHGTPFEHGMITFRIGAPIFVWREFMRHRIGISYNEQSGRYMELEPVFYVPPTHRPLVQEGKQSQYNLVDGTDGQHNLVMHALHQAYSAAWESYQMQLQANVAKEVARVCLPLAIFSSAYVTMNPRSLMHFLSLRTKVEGSKFPSYPQWEINQVATSMEIIFENYWPLTYKAFHENGRVCP